MDRENDISDLLEASDRSNAENRSPSDQERTSMVNGLRKKLRDIRNRLRNVGSENKETVEKRYSTIIDVSENPNDSILDRLVETSEIRQETQDAIEDLEKDLNELRQVFLNMAAFVQSQGEELDDIASQVNKAKSFVRDGTTKLELARRHQNNKNMMKWTCFGIILVVIVILIIVLLLS